jgi:hypothetical protein
MSCYDWTPATPAMWFQREGINTMIKDVHSVGVALAKEADERRPELERERRVPADLFHRAAEAGLFRQL